MFGIIVDSDEEWEESPLNARNFFGDSYVDAVFKRIKEMEEENARNQYDQH